MNRLKSMIIVMLMLTSVLAGCTGTDTTDLEQQIADLQQSNDEMNETINQQNQANTELQTQLDERNTEIATLNTNVAMLQSSIIDAETYRDSLLVLLEDSNNTILTLQSDIVVQQNLVVLSHGLTNCVKMVLRVSLPMACQRLILRNGSIRALRCSMVLAMLITML